MVKTSHVNLNIQLEHSKVTLGAEICLRPRLLICGHYISRQRALFARPAMHTSANGRGVRRQDCRRRKVHLKSR